ncbi:MAG: hypothetical protein Q8Q09_08590 [Deltaproteobacteria bacterium]|nr:hypothetical protein [Deltaproteobacteria bacterium]
MIVNSNAPTTLPVVYRAWVRDGAQLAQAAGDASLFWAQFAGRGASDGDSFSVVPRAGVARDGVFSVLVEAQSGMLVVRRVLRARFTPRVSTTLRIPLNFDCTLETSGCLGSPIPCTIQRLCEERGQTCGESGQCIPIDVVANREDGGVDGAVLSVLPRSDASAMNDAADDRARDAEDVQSIDDVADSGAADVPTMDSCAPSCAGRVCGSNGCSGSCGTCSGGLTCNGSGQCVMSCTPNCAGRVCGSNGCSGSCGSCTAPRTCNGSGQCVCTPSCAGKRCGPDGCGGSCGSCPAGLTCNGAGTGCFCPAGCSGSSSNCRDACGYSNTACRSQCPSNRTCNLGTGNCDCATITCGTTCCPTGTIYCRGSVCCTDCGRPSPVCNLC